MIKKGWFSDLEIQEISGNVNREECERDILTRIETCNIEKQEPPTKFESKILKTENTTDPSTI